MRRGNTGRKQQQQQEDPLALKRQRAQQQQQQQPPSSSSDDEAFDDEGFGLTEDQMMQMMMRANKGAVGTRGMYDDEQGDEFDGIGDFPMPFDDEGDDGFDYDGFYDDEDEGGDLGGDFDFGDDEEEEEFEEDDDENGHPKSDDMLKQNLKKLQGRKDPRVEVLESDDEPAGDDNEDDDEAPINVNFSVDNMVEEDVPKVASHLGNYFPDPEKSKCDVEALSKLIFNKGLGTSVVLASQEGAEGDDDEEEEEDQVDEDGEKKSKPLMDNDEDPEQELYGVLSLVTKLPENSIVKPLETELFKEVLDKLSSSTAVHPISLLRGGNTCTNALVVSELFSQLPPQLIARLYSVFIEEVEQGCNGKNGAPSKVPSYVVFLSKIMPANAKSEDKTPLTASAQNAKAYSNEKSTNKPNKRGHRVDESTGELIVGDDSKQDGDEYVTFLRFEEDLFYRNRDSNGTQVVRGRFNGDPADHRRCLCYALTWKNFKSAVQELSILN